MINVAQIGAQLEDVSVRINYARDNLRVTVALISGLTLVEIGRWSAIECLEYLDLFLATKGESNG